MNDDYPPEDREVRKFDHFAPPQIQQCHRYTTRVLDGDRIITAHHILEPAPIHELSQFHSSSSSHLNLGDHYGGNQNNSSSSSISKTHFMQHHGNRNVSIPMDEESDDELEYDDSAMSDDDSNHNYDNDSDNHHDIYHESRKTQGVGTNTSSTRQNPSSSSSRRRIPQDQNPAPQKSKYAYWLAKSKAEAIYGQVWVGRVLQRRMHAPEHEPQWIVTQRSCAVKEYRWHRIMEEQNSAEDPRREVAAMQHLQRFHLKLLEQEVEKEGNEEDHYDDHNDHHRQDQQQHPKQRRRLWSEDILRERAEEFMLESNVMMPLDVLSDNQFLYTVMPYCNGGELFAVLEERTKFTEGEARYWIKRVLNGIETLQRAGVCHRDMSLENLLTNDRGDAVIIDLGMSIKIPYLEQPSDQPLLDYRSRQRCLIRRDRACGKPYYMAPEIRRNVSPFDGHAVDMWAVGPILFLMVAGFPPWEQATNADERFYYFSNGYLGQTVRSWNLDMSEELLDLLQGMFWADPRRRLSLSQVRSHPWMQGEEEAPPPMKRR